MACPTCNVALPPGARFCGRCGSAVSSSGPATAADRSNTPPPPASAYDTPPPLLPFPQATSGGVHPVTWAALALALLISVATGSYLLLTGDADGASEGTAIAAASAPTGPAIPLPSAGPPLTQPIVEPQPVDPPLDQPIDEPIGIFIAPPPDPEPVVRAPVPVEPVRSQSQTIGAGPSFSCARATTAVEQMVCGSSRLSSLERQMVNLYNQLRSNRNLRQRILADQRLFLSILSECQTPECIEQLYVGRIDELSRY